MFGLLCVVVVTILLNACGPKYYIVESEFISSEIGEQPATVTKTKLYSEAFPTIKTLAIKAPDQCISETSSQKTGEAKSGDKIMQTACGVEMAHIERALAKAGFGVISWKVLENAMIVASKQNMTHLSAARDLGADAMFQINSFERSVSHGGADARWERRFYKSDGRASVLGPAKVTESTASDLNKLSKDNETGKIDGLKRLSATINASATYVKNGQAFWFYEWNHKQQHDSDNVKFKTHIECEDKRPRFRCWERKEQKQRKSTLTSGSSEAVTIGSRPEDIIRYRHDQLLKEVINLESPKFSA